MSQSKLPERPSLEYLRKIAHARLLDQRRDRPQTKLSDALVAVAREYGFASWRALKEEVERRQNADVVGFFDACRRGDAAHVSRRLESDPQLARATLPNAPHPGWTALHTAAQAGHGEVLKVLLAHGAVVDAREAGDNTTALHWAAARADIALVRTLLDAGADVHGAGDAHALDVIGWAAYFRDPSAADTITMDDGRRACIEYLVERGARHHIFSAMCVGDLPLIQAVVERSPDALERRMSRFERGLTALHFAIARRRHDILALLLDLGADVNATEASGQTPITAAMLADDRDATAQLQAAGATLPAARGAAATRTEMQKLAAFVRKGVPMIKVSDVARALAWYASIGFHETARFEDDGIVNFGIVSLGGAELMLNMHGASGRHDASLWFYTDNVDAIYESLKSRQLAAVQATMRGEPADADALVFEQEIEDMFYGARQFCIRDPDGYELYFIQDKPV